MNQSLIDDFLVFSDKIGSANFFWSFPSKAYQDQCARRDGQQATLSGLQASIEGSKSQLKLAKAARCGENRAKLMDELAALRRQEEQLDTQLVTLKVNDPEEIKRVEKLAMVNKAAADRWTDNIWQIKGYMTKRKGMSGKEVCTALFAFTRLLTGHCPFIPFAQVDKLLGIDGDFDYVEYQLPSKKKSVK